jgi:phospholipase C
MSTPDIEHIVVLMLENRSYDNVLGALYSPTNAAPYQTPPVGQPAPNGIPAGASSPGPNGTTVPAHNQTTPTQRGTSGPAYAPTAIPLVDPGEYFKDVAQQLLGLTDVPTSPPWSGYEPTRQSATGGYVYNYATLNGVAQTTPPEQNWPDVMNHFTPAQLPVSAFLANRYGLSDDWFAPVPSQTYVNRAFALSAAPGVSTTKTPFGMIDDAQYFTDPIAEMPTIFSQLDEGLSDGGAQGPFWKVYFHDYSITFDTLKYVQTTVAAGKGLNVGTFDDSDWGTQTPKQLKGHKVASSFVDDVENGSLPPFSWIEPRYFDDYAPTALPPNSNHPGSATKPPLSSGTQAPIDVATGEVLLMGVYNMLRASPMWAKTLLIVTYDESCGLWDHVPAPLAAPPGPSVPPARCDSDPAADGFAFDVFGGRVPAIVASPYVAPGSVFRADSQLFASDTHFDHTSIITTVRDVFLQPLRNTPALTGRDAAAPSLLPGLQGSPLNITGLFEENGTGLFEGTIVAGPASLYFYHKKAHSDPAPQTVFASAGPAVTLEVSALQTQGESWLSVTAAQGPTTTITVTADPTHLAAGSYFGQLSISSTDASRVSNSPVLVPVQLEVASLL